MIGIYKIENMINHKVYIGQSWNISHRKGEHKHLYKENEHFYNSVKKYNIENFSFKVLIKFKDGPFTQKYLDKFEAYFGNMYAARNPEKGYNIRDYGSKGKLSESTKNKISILAKNRMKIKENNPMYGKHHSEKTKELIGKLAKERLSEPNNNPMYGKCHSDESKKKIGIKNKGNQPRKGVKLSEETKNRISKKNKGRKMSKEFVENVKNFMKILYSNPEFKQKMNKIHAKKVQCIETNKIFNSIKEASEEYHCNPEGIGRCCRGKNNTCDGFHWKYI